MFALKVPPQVLHSCRLRGSDCASNVPNLMTFPLSVLPPSAQRGLGQALSLPWLIQEHSVLACGKPSHVISAGCGHQQRTSQAPLCPSCIAKRSALTAAHLTDQVLPECDYRQWTLSVPYALRYRLIRDNRLLSQVVSIFVRTVFAWQRRRAKAAGLTDVHTGSVSMVQRFGSLVQVHPHTHTWIPDGVFVKTDAGTLRFTALPPPTDGDVAKLCALISRRVMRLCEGQDEELADDDDVAMAAAQANAMPSPLSRPHWFEQSAQPAAQTAPLSALHGGFSLHAGLMVRRAAIAGLPSGPRRLHPLWRQAPTHRLHR